MESDALTALVDAIAESGGSLPGVSGDAGTASSFAGQWTERRKSAATPFKGLRIYELIALREIACVEGKLWQADSGDRPLVEEWVGSFSSETGARPTNIERLVDEWLAAGQVWLWQNGEAVSMAVTRVPVEKVVRIASVYTPPDRRRRGYAAACVEGISRQLTEAGLRCMLYTDLANPTSNSIYRQIGYSAVAEGLSYRFHAS
jgi:predicted GNAT family acetyltransferase